jgi:indole-3-glycerol phosphate synthase
MALKRFRMAKAEELARLRSHRPTTFFQGKRPDFIWGLVHRDNGSAQPRPPVPACTVNDCMEGESVVSRRRGGQEPLIADRQSGSIAVIAEYKRSSPSRGVINEGITPAEIAHLYTEGGAQAISVLTEKNYFGGDLAFLHEIAKHTHLPLLRKDFIFDPLQVLETAATPASALLLIVTLTPERGHLRDLRLLAESFGIEAVVEIVNEVELECAREAGARIIQVNNRNLETLEIDMSTTLRLIRQRLPQERWIAASGIDSHDALTRLAGYDAALIGSALMADENPAQALRQLLGNDNALLI